MVCRVVKANLKVSKMLGSESQCILHKRCQSAKNHRKCEMAMDAYALIEKQNTNKTSTLKLQRLKI